MSFPSCANTAQNASTLIRKPNSKKWAYLVECAKPRLGQELGWSFVDMSSLFYSVETAAKIHLDITKPYNSQNPHNLKQFEKMMPTLMPVLSGYEDAWPSQIYLEDHLAQMITWDKLRAEENRIHNVINNLNKVVITENHEFGGMQRVKNNSDGRDQRDAEVQKKLADEAGAANITGDQADDHDHDHSYYWSLVHNDVSFSYPIRPGSKTTVTVKNGTGDALMTVTVQVQ
ncbi:hypothetical protein BV25DRAFT_1995475 [Artomyces pyxidatus]|uniref:Uncharacterized protein n=1 Tax=Artomyces pyxidatus TaxID=48021 RepID=A0ACB8SJR9_9AGAM|nr:hypothetical protein BV25DRAFT_1995475 [Artomyces pyxidatus]